MYKILYEERVYKDLDVIPNRDLEKIDKIFQALPLNPRPHGCAKLKGNYDYYRIRQGRYRIIYTINDSENIITVLSVRHRKDVYRGLN